MGFTEGVTTGNQGNGFFIVHGHARKRFANVVGGSLRVRVAIGTFRIHIDQPHHGGCERVLQVSLIREPGVIGEPVFFAAPVHVLIRFPGIFTTTGKTKGFKAHGFQCHVTGKNDQIRPGNLAAVFLFHRPDQSAGLVQIDVIRPAIERGKTLLAATAAATGASAHIAHVNSTSPKDIDLVLDLLEGAAAHGVDMSADAYPWEAGSTGLESSVFDEGFRERMSIGYGDIELVSTGERLTEDTFRRYRSDQKRDGVIVHFIPTETLRKALTSPIVMVASDGAISPEGRGHPRGAGTYARFLRQYVREWGDVTLVEAMRKTSFLAAVQLQQASPAMRRKGRLSAGADADIVVFDLATVRERATYLEPAQTSVGIEHVWVNGVLVVDSGELVAGVAPGRAIRGAPQRGR